MPNKYKHEIRNVCYSGFGSMVTHCKNMRGKDSHGGSADRRRGRDNDRGGRMRGEDSGPSMKEEVNK